MASRILPDDPLSFLRVCAHEGRLHWTHHVSMRLERRYVPRVAIIESTTTWEIIESYPEDKYLPSYLVWLKYREEAFHVLLAADVPGHNARVVTAYRPSPEKWEADLKTRRLR